MFKHIDVTAEYLQLFGTGSDDFSTRLIRAIIHEAKNNSQLVAIGYKHRHPLFGHEYPRQLNNIAEQKEYLNAHLAETDLKQVQLNYWPDEGEQCKIIWQRKQ